MTLLIINLSDHGEKMAIEFDIAGIPPEKDEIENIKAKAVAERADFRKRNIRLFKGKA